MHTHDRSARRTLIGWSETVAYLTPSESLAPWVSRHHFRLRNNPWTGAVPHERAEIVWNACPGPARRAIRGQLLTRTHATRPTRTTSVTRYTAFAVFMQTAPPLALLDSSVWYMLRCACGKLRGEATAMERVSVLGTTRSMSACAQAKRGRGGDADTMARVREAKMGQACRKACPR